MRFTPLILSLALVAPSFAATPPAVVREEVGNRVSENVPAVPAELVDRLNRYQNTRGASFSGWLPDGSLVISTRFGETNQAHRVRTPMGAREQLTFYPEPISAVNPAPGKNGFVFGKDVGGSEFWQLHWFDLDTREVTMLTDGKRSQNSAPLWSKDGKQLAWSSTARNGTDYDLWIRDMATGESRMVLSEGGLWNATGFSPDGGKLLVTRYVSINESYPGELDLATGKLEMFPVDGGRAAFGGFQYAPDGKGVYFISDEERQFRTLRFHDPDSGRPWPALPPVLLALASRAAAMAGFDGFVPDACLVNHYLPGTRLSLHQDRDEGNYDHPIVSVSLGIPAIFLWGGALRADKARRVGLWHGDVVVWGGPARLRFHGVAPLADASHAMTGGLRINLTFRKAR